MTRVPLHKLTEQVPEAMAAEAALERARAAGFAILNIVHEEHGPISIPQGTYRVWRQREYYAQLGTHLVQDDLAGGVSRSRLIAGTAANIRVPEERLELSRDFSRWILRILGRYTGRQQV